MARTEPTWSDAEVDEHLGLLLRIGVVLAAIVVVFGGALYLARHGTHLPEFERFHGEPSDLRHVSGILRGATTLHGRGVIQLGLLLLIATPVARVGFSLFAFWRQSDRAYMWITSTVLLLLLLSLSGAI